MSNRILLVGGWGGIGSAIWQQLTKDAPTRYVDRPNVTELDVTNDGQVEEYLKKWKYETLIYCAGENYLAWGHDLDIQRAAQVFDVNVLGFLRMVKHGSFGQIIVIGSDAAEKPMRTSSVYNASKAALHAAALCIARERAGAGVHVNVVAPGKIIDTDMTKYVERQTKEIRGWTPQDLIKYETGQIPMGRYGAALEVAEVVSWLITSAPEYLNGQVIKVNGGR